MQKSKKTGRQEFWFLYILKAAAISLIIYYHSFWIPIEVNEFSFGNAIAYLIYTCAGLGVPIFFTVNGFLLFGSPFSWKKHGIRFLKTVGITVIWAVITLAVRLWIKGEKYGLNEFIKALVTLKAGYINHLWFMEALAALYLIFPALLWLYRRHSRLFFFVLLGAAVYTIAVPAVLFAYSVLAPVWKLEIPQVISSLSGKLPGVYFQFSVSYFMAGGFLRKKLPEIEQGKSKRSLIITGFLVCLAIAAQYILGSICSLQRQSLFDNAWENYRSLFGFAAVIGIFVLSCQYMADKQNGVWKQIAQNSLGIYYVHFIIIELFWKLGFFGDNLIKLILFTACTETASYTAVKYLRRVPIAGILFGGMKTDISGGKGR